MIIPIHYGHSAPLTLKDAHTLVGIFVVLNALWVIFLAYSFICKKINKREYVVSDFLGSFFNFSMTIIWAMIILVFLGSYVAELIF